MVELISMKFKDGTIVYVEAADSAKLQGAPMIQEAGVGEQAEKSLATAMELTGSIKAFCDGIISSFHEMNEKSRPFKATIEFGLDISLEGNVFLVKGTGLASIKIKAEWQLDRLNQNI